MVVDADDSGTEATRRKLGLKRLTSYVAAIEVTPGLSGQPRRGKSVRRLSHDPAQGGGRFQAFGSHDVDVRRRKAGLREHVVDGLFREPAVKLDATEALLGGSRHDLAVHEQRGAG